MATSILKPDRFGAEKSNDITRGSGAETVGGNIVYHKASGVVHIDFRALNSSNMSIDAVLATIPEKYRPSTDQGGSCIIAVADGTITVGSWRVRTDGTIQQRSTSTARRMFGVIEYVF